MPSRLQEAGKPEPWVVRKRAVRRDDDDDSGRVTAASVCAEPVPREGRVDELTRAATTAIEDDPRLALARAQNPAGWV